MDDAAAKLVPLDPHPLDPHPLDQPASRWVVRRPNCTTGGGS